MYVRPRYTYGAFFISRLPLDKLYFAGEKFLEIIHKDERGNEMTKILRFIMALTVLLLAACGNTNEEQAKDQADGNDSLEKVKVVLD